MTLPTRIDLAVPYSRKEEAKALGARWDSDQRTWYAPAGTDLRHFDRRWLPKGCEPDQESKPPSSEAGAEPEKGVSLTDLLAQVKGVIDRGLPDAVWVRAEVSELRGKNGHLYLSLTERNERGDSLANAKGIIWKNRATAITANFEQATGEGLKTDIKILCLVRVRFDVLYGLDLIIEDVDPSYTLGDLAAKLARIREWLIRDDLYERNRSLPTPVEFVRVAVISPETSAGLGDFRRETDRLQHAGLCEFHYFGATFQGLDAPSSLRTAVNEALAAHRQRRFDALVVIRGGGSVTDLAWLNDLELARLLCQSPIPFVTGIGHERDSTILDEIAHRRFDTPSKVALHITTTIRDNALAAITALDQIKLQVARTLSRERTALATQVDRVQDGVRSIMQQAEDDHRQFMTVIRTVTHFQLREASQSLDAGYARLISMSDATICEADLKIKQSMETIAHRSQLDLGLQQAAVEKAASAIALQATAKIESAVFQLDNQQAQVVREARRWVSTLSSDLGKSIISIAAQAVSVAETAKNGIETYARIVVGLGPRATLKRGFSIVRDTEDRPITSREAAMKSPEFTVQFHDGNVPVANQDFESGGV
jgi:exodeoxyribonuclease VII large subunit